MRLHRFLPVSLLCGLACPAVPLQAQTYVPKQIRFEGGGDPAELLRLTGLQPGKSITREQIEAAMAKLADTGAFTDLSYTVSATALVIKLGGAAEAPGQALPVRYANLVWWKPDELTRLLEQRVPLFHGQLPLTGTLTDHVCDVLVQLLAEKGVPNARVEAMPSTLHSAAQTAPGESPAAKAQAQPSVQQAGRGGELGSIALTVVKPEIVLGNVTLAGAVSSTQTQLDAVTGMLSMQDFQTDVTAKAIRDNISDTEKNAGYLDAVVEPPVFSAPREDMNGYAIDAAATVHPGELYRIAGADFGARPPLTEAQSATAADLKIGQPAGAMAMRLSVGTLQREYFGHGYLGTEIKLQSTLNRELHTVTLRYTVEPGELYHLAGVDSSALAPDLQAAFAREFQGQPGMEAGPPLGNSVEKALAAMNVTRSVDAVMLLHRKEHTVTVVLRPADAGNVPHRPN